MRIVTGQAGICKKNTGWDLQKNILKIFFEKCSEFLLPIYFQTYRIDPMRIEDLITRYDISKLTNNTVLIVDDEKENIQIMELVLGKHFNVLSATSGREALDILENKDCDVIVADQRMPGMTGVELLELTRKMDRDITGIVVTAYAEYKAIMAAINQGQAFKFILKPFDGTQLVASIHEAMEKTFYERAIRALVSKLDYHIETLEQKNSELHDMQGKLLMAERFGTVGRMTSGIVHDMGNALSGLLFMSQELRESDCAKDIRDVFNLSVNGLERLHNTLNEIRSFVRDGSNIETLHKEAVEPKKILQDAVKLSRLDKEARQRRIEWTVQPDMPEVVVDWEMVVQSLVNLIGNAVDATEKDGQIMVEASSRNDWLKITVRDNGTGMDEEVTEHVFEPMFSTKEAGGLGMGLFMVESIIKAHGGSVGVQSQQGEGTEFRIILPLDRNSQ